MSKKVPAWNSKPHNFPKWGQAKIGICFVIVSCFSTITKKMQFKIFLFISQKLPYHEFQIQTCSFSAPIKVIWAFLLNSSTACWSYYHILWLLLYSYFHTNRMSTFMQYQNYKELSLRMLKWSFFFQCTIRIELPYNFYQMAIETHFSQILLASGLLMTLLYHLFAKQLQRCTSLSSFSWWPSCIC